MIDNIKNTIKKLGLRDSEVSVYLCCLKNLPGLKVQQISDLTKIKRSTVNLITERLTEKGFLSYFLDGKRKIYTAEQPEQILYNLQDTVTDFKSIIPLIKDTIGTTTKSRIKIFEGKDDIEKIYADMLLTMRLNNDPKKEILAFGSGKDIFTLLPDHQKNFIDKRVKERIPLRWIAPDDEVSQELYRTNQENLRQIKKFDTKKYPFPLEIDIYSDKVNLISLEEQSIGVIIENKKLSQAFTSLFNLVWNLLK